MKVVQVNIGYDHVLTFTPVCVMKVVVEGANYIVLFRRSILDRHQ